MYLKDILKATSPLTARITSIGPIETNKNGKELRKVQFLFSSTGKMHEEGVFEFNFKSPRGNLVGLKVGDTVEMKLEKDWPVYRIIQATAEFDGAPTMNNYQQVNNERKASGIVSDSQKEKELKDIQISLQGFAQSFTTGKLAGGLSSFGTMEELANAAIEYAVAAREALIAKSKEIQAGISMPEPTMDASSLPF